MNVPAFNLMPTLPDTCTLELFTNNQWRAVATLTRNPLGAAKGFKGAVRLGYDTRWAFEYLDKSDAFALAINHPVGLDTQNLSGWPTFLIDMLPQGFGRAELLRQLGLPAGSEGAADWALLLHGAGNPIGHLRIQEAAHWLATRQADLSQRHLLRGFTDQEVGARTHEFIDHLAQHGLFVAGSSGVQGEWPKLLMTRAKDGLLYLDHLVTDAQAKQHYIVKFSRGSDAALNRILRHEAPYMHLAHLLGLFVYAPLQMVGKSLLIPRFDRHIAHNNPEQAVVRRVAQESLASLMGVSGFEQLPSHNEVCKRLALVCTSPLQMVAEYICRDIANLAFGNKDNHGRNTAIQRDFDEVVSLAPLYDFAPMYLHPNGIARRMRWEGEQAGSPDWLTVLTDVVKRCGFDAQEMRYLKDHLRGFASKLHAGLHAASSLGFEASVLKTVAPWAMAQIAALERLKG